MEMRGEGGEGGEGAGIPINAWSIKLPKSGFYAHAGQHFPLIHVYPLLPIIVPPPHTLQTAAPPLP